MTAESMNVCSRAGCGRSKSKGRDDGLCRYHRNLIAQNASRKAARDAREVKPKIGRPVTRPDQTCGRCSATRRPNKLYGGVCGRCRQKERTIARRLGLVEDEHDTPAVPCSVSGCSRPRELERTCIEHAPRFENIRSERTQRADDFAFRSRDVQWATP